MERTLEYPGEFIGVGLILFLILLVVHFNVRGLRHSSWRPWDATGRFMLEFLWPFVLAFGAIWLAFGVLGIEESPLAHRFWLVVVGVPAIVRAQRVLKRPAPA